LKGFKYDTKTPVLAKYRGNLAEFGRDSWDEQWKATIVPAVIKESEKRGPGLNKKEL
jgi:hypothetical protein